MKRTVFRRKATAKKFRGTGRRVYKTKAGWKVSPECPRARAKRRELIKQRTRTRRASTRARFKRLRWLDSVPF